MANDRTAPGGMGMLLLALLEGRDMYGYEMIEALRARSNEVFRLKAGTLYPLLHSLEAQGWVTSSDGVANGRTRRYYAITRDGRAALAEQQAGWYAYADAVRGVLPPPPRGWTPWCRARWCSARPPSDTPPWGRR